MDVQNIDVDKLDAFTKAYIETALWSSSVEQAGVDLGVASHTDTSAQHAHDFWLTRNRHGAGFWDGDYPEELGKKLTEASHAFGECDLYIGDDGKVHVSNAHEYQEQELDEELTKGVSR